MPRLADIGAGLDQCLQTSDRPAFRRFEKRRLSQLVLLLGIETLFEQPFQHLNIVLPDRITQWRFAIIPDGPSVCARLDQKSCLLDVADLNGKQKRGPTMAIDGFKVVFPGHGLLEIADCAKGDGQENLGPAKPGGIAARRKQALKDRIAIGFGSDFFHRPPVRSGQFRGIDLTFQRCDDTVKLRQTIGYNCREIVFHCQPS